MRRMVEIIVGVALVLVAAYAVKENLRYAREGLRTTGTVVTITNRVELDGDSVSHTQSPVVEFKPVDGGVARRFRSSIWSHAWLTPKTGETVPVVHLPGAPEDARIDSYWHWLLPALFGAFGIAALMGWTHGSWRRSGLVWSDD